MAKKRLSSFHPPPLHKGINAHVHFLKELHWAEDVETVREEEDEARARDTGQAPEPPEKRPAAPGEPPQMLPNTVCHEVLEEVELPERPKDEALESVVPATPGDIQRYKTPTPASNAQLQAAAEDDKVRFGDTSCRIISKGNLIPGQAAAEEDPHKDSHGERPRAMRRSTALSEWISRSVSMVAHPSKHIRSRRASAHGPFVQFVQSPNFDLLSGLLIISSTVAVGAETDWTAQHHGNSTETYATIRFLFFLAFLIELVMRIAAAGRKFFAPGPDFSWNVFDSFMVASSILEVFLDNLDTGGAAQTGRVLRILRIVRITRALRIGRLLRYARTFQQIAYSLQSSVGTLFWALVMIFLVVYCFAICFTQASMDHMLEGSPTVELKRSLKENYSTVPHSLYSLYRAMTGGQSWGEVADPLIEVGWPYGLLFIAYISISFFGVLNVVTAIFVDTALQSQAFYKDLLIQESMMKKAMYIQHLKDVFNQIDADGSGSINGDEMEYFLQDPGLNQYLESIDIFPNDARALFRLLDADDSGQVSIDEFCQGCLRLKGEAKSFDIHCLIYSIEKVLLKLGHLEDNLQVKFLDRQKTKSVMSTYSYISSAANSVHHSSLHEFGQIIQDIGSIRHNNIGKR